MARTFNSDAVFRAAAADTSSTNGTVIDMSDAYSLTARLRATAKAGSGTPTLKIWFQARHGGVWYDMPTAGTQPNKWTFPTLSNVTGSRLLRMQHPIPKELRVRSVVSGGTGKSFTWEVRGSKVFFV